LQQGNVVVTSVWTLLKQRMECCSGKYDESNSSSESETDSFDYSPAAAQALNRFSSYHLVFSCAVDQYSSDGHESPTTIYSYSEQQLDSNANFQYSYTSDGVFNRSATASSFSPVEKIGPGCQVTRELTRKDRGDCFLCGSGNRLNTTQPSIEQSSLVEEAQSKLRQGEVSSRFNGSAWENCSVARDENKVSSHETSMTAGETDRPSSRNTFDILGAGNTRLGETSDSNALGSLPPSDDCQAEKPDTDKIKDEGGQHDDDKVMRGNWQCRTDASALARRRMLILQYGDKPHTAYRPPHKPSVKDYNEFHKVKRS